MAAEAAILPDSRGHFGAFGGRFVPETLIPALDELAAEDARAKADPEFQRELDYYFRDYVGQILLARRMGKPRIIAETGAGQHGVATATACARFGFECEVYMGEEDIHRQALNVVRMRLLGTKVVPVTSGTRTLKD